MVIGTQDLLSIDRVRIRNASNNNEEFCKQAKFLISPKVPLIHLLLRLYIAVQKKRPKILPLIRLIYLPKLNLNKD